MASSQLFVGTPKSPQARISVANANRDGTGTVVDLYTAGASGGRVDDIKIKANGATTAGMIRFYKHDGANYRLLTERVVGVVNPAASTPAFEDTLTDLGWILANGHKIAVSTEKAENFEIHVTRGGDF
jgi:hypothetical protein